ncbi:MAG: acetylornithine deacetylase [Pseudomonadota bacterium]
MIPGASVELLARLVAFPTVSRTPNLALIEMVRARLEASGARTVVIPAADGTRANLFASVGPHTDGGVMLSGHTDVVPVEGQAWTVPPFALTSRDGRHYGRGTADMKGFVAAAVACVEQAASQPLRAPLHLALSFDEEIGCVGVRSLIDMLATAPYRPRFCIVGEPTGMGIATGHKGKVALRARFRGREAHSALAPTGLNALHLAADFVQDLRSLQLELECHGPRDGDYDVPYTTVHVGTLGGGTALNIVPNSAAADFEIRNVASDDPDAILARLEAVSAARLHSLRETFPEAAVEIEQVNSYPGLATPPDAEIVDFMRALTGVNKTHKVAFGTEGGLFSARLGLPVVVCGPGSMAQGHKPDEFVSDEQMKRCDAVLEKLVARLRDGF